MTNSDAAPAEVAAARLRPVLSEVVEIRAQIAALQAREVRALAEASAIAQEWADAAATRSDAELAHRSVAADLASALRVSDRTVQRQLGDAERLVTRFPETVASLERGRISLAHARVIAEAADRIHQPELLAEYEQTILPYAEAESASRLRPVAKRRAQWFLDETIRERHAAAAAQRSVRVHDLDDGMAALEVVGPAVVIHGIYDRVTRMARDVADADAQALADAKAAAAEAEREAKAAERAAAAAERSEAATRGAAANARDASAGGSDASAQESDASPQNRAGAAEGHEADAGIDTQAPAHTGMRDDNAVAPSAPERARLHADDARERATQARTSADDLAAARRTLDALRVDILADLLLASDPAAHVGTRETGLGAIRATVQVTVPVLTLLDSPVDDPFDAVTLTGHGPIDPDTARELTAGAPGWDRILTHPISGTVLTVDRYEPTKRMRRHLAVRDQHCRFPGCRQSTTRSDLDHTRDWALGGPTDVGNLAHLCRRHHTLKHHTPWTVVQQPGGILEWTSPTGHRYPSHPASGVHFATDAEFDPAPF
ncbi:HNH endonuclease signature motif containing protein [Microbacterium thalassium]|uniref:HNH nuclease domain-containing protein n=1 Tax=Microbacterium thalassium TaxID=362649 RepID=A0A7X0FS85_9MICO|nr:HNH endonuclease signature motif containing protein [Microbacterium thalassium]MBB6392736.1 hypothetical protein [Microbacterium thalassium]GLK23032.1 hypothetical protein GCM10017607_03500 [Microbacterium thalassium]